MTPDEELVHLLDMVWASLGSLGDELSEQEWKLPTEVPGWSVQDNLAHITGIESSLLGRAAPKHEIAGDLRARLAAVPHLRLMGARARHATGSATSG